MKSKKRIGKKIIIAEYKINKSFFKETSEYYFDLNKIFKNTFYPIHRKKIRIFVFGQVIFSQ